MEFGSVVFLLRFLPVFLIAYYLVPGRMKNIVLLLGSLCFYSWGKPIYLLPMAVSAGSDFIHGRLIEKHRGKGTANVLLSSALIFDFALLFFFGYADFFIETLNLAWGFHWIKFGFTMPAGITIYTLQTMSYVIDVYRGKCKAARNPLEYATFVTMFPQLPAGPIVRYVDVKDSLRERKVTLHQVSEGAQRICYGLAKKVLIADSAGVIWSSIQQMRLDGISVATAWLGVMAYAFRIYYAYSGYCDMAIGLGTCLGFKFPESYDHPFVARSISDFLRRWNFSLTKWMKEYFYQSAMRERKGLLQSIFWALITFCLIGLWYGPDWTFLLWGLWMGILYILEKLFLGKLLKLLPYPFGWAYAMLAVTFGWVFLAMNDLMGVWEYLQIMFGAREGGLFDHRFLFLVLENFPVLAGGILFSLPLFSGIFKKLQDGRNGAAIALTRLIEKVCPAACLLASLVYMIGKNW